MRRFRNRELNVTAATVLTTVLLQFLFIRYASYGIAKDDFGNFVLLQTLVMGLSALFLQIPGQSFDRFYNGAAEKTEFLNEFRTLLLAINGLSFFVVLLYGSLFDKFSTELLTVIFVYFVLLNSYELNQKFLLLNQQRGRYFYTRLLEALSKFILPIFAYIYFQTLESLFAAIVIGYLVSSSVALAFLREYPYAFVVRWENLKKYFLFAYPIVFVSIFTWGISFSDRYFIEYYLSTEDVAIYSLLAMVAGVGQIAGQIYFLYVEPKVLKSYEADPDKTFAQIAAYLKKLLLLFTALTIAAVLLPKEIYTVLLEKEIVYNDYDDPPCFDLYQHTPCGAPHVFKAVEKIGCVGLYLFVRSGCKLSVKYLYQRIRDHNGGGVDYHRIHDNTGPADHICQTPNQKNRIKVI